MARVGLCLGAVLLGPALKAAVPVEDMSTGDARVAPEVSLETPQPVLPEALVQPATPGSQPRPASGTGAAPTTLAPGQNAQMFYEIQQLQSEVLQLRGLIEDQAFEIKRLRDLQRSQYLDIDRRLSGAGTTSPQDTQIVSATVPERVSVPVESTQGPLRTPQPVVSPSAAETPSRSAAAAPSISVQTGGAVAERPAPPVEVAPAPAVAPTEQEAYAAAFDLMKDQQFAQSIDAYQGVIDNFPDGSYAPESRYWLGELYLMSDRLEDAKGSFSLLVDQFPAHQRVPLSLYKLGVVNHRLGATPRALEYLDDVVVRYPDTPAAGLARTYASELR